MQSVSALLYLLTLQFKAQSQTYILLSVRYWLTFHGSQLTLHCVLRAAIVPVLLGALKNPGRNTSRCLQALLHTKFVHFIDSPSLALIMPVVERAFEDRSTETRKMSAQIIGNMYSLTDSKDLSPYLPAIIPGLKASLLDPVPKVSFVESSLRCLVDIFWIHSRIYFCNSAMTYLYLQNKT